MLHSVPPEGLVQFGVSTLQCPGGGSNAPRLGRVVRHPAGAMVACYGSLGLTSGEPCRFRAYNICTTVEGAVVELAWWAWEGGKWRFSAWP